MKGSRIRTISSGGYRIGRSLIKWAAMERLLDAGYTVTIIEDDKSETRGAGVAKDVTPPGPRESRRRKAVPGMDPTPHHGKGIGASKPYPEK